MNSILADPVAFIVAVVVTVLAAAVIVWDLWTTGGKPDKEHRCPRCGSRHHTDCYDGERR